MPPPDLRHVHLSAAQRRRLANATRSFPVPSVSCQPLGTGCDGISTSTGGATGVKGLNAVDSATSPLVPPAGLPKDIEPPDQGLCAGNGSVVETNNIGEILVFNTALKRKSAPISFDTIMGLTKRHWSSGGDPSCVYDPANGGHWFFTEIVWASPESQGGAFTGCFVGVAHKCMEGIAVTDGNSPFGPYHVYFSNADYNPAEPGYPSLLNDFAKISVTRDAFMMLYDEFPLSGSLPGMGGGFFNGAQEFAFRKSALEQGLPVKKNGKPNPAVTVARENMGHIPTPDGTCARDKILHQGGITCWVAVIPAQPVAGQFDNNHGGTGFMEGSLDFYGFLPLATSGDNRIAAWAWTGLSALDSSGCASCSSAIRFQGQLFSGVDRYYDPETVNFGGIFAPQRTGPIPLGDDCSAISGTDGPLPGGRDQHQRRQPDAGLAGARPAVDRHQHPDRPDVYQSQRRDPHGRGVLGGQQTVIRQDRQVHLDQPGYVSPKHEDLSMPAMAATPTNGGKAIMLFTLTGNGGPTGADHGGFFPSTAFGRVTSASGGMLNSKVNVADLGKSPQDGFTEYQGFPGTTRPRWGDYSWGLFVPGTGGRIYFANEYIQYPNCPGKAFDPNAIPTCGGTRDGMANWGTSVNS